MNSLAIYKKADALVRQCETKDPLQIAKEIGILVQYSSDFSNLLGMYICRWNHRAIILNANMGRGLKQCVTAHEIGHDSEHREEAKAGSMKEFSLYYMKDNKEYEANAFASHILLDNDRVYYLAQQGYDLEHIAGTLGVDMNMTLIKMSEMNKLGYDFRMPCEPDGRYLRNVQIRKPKW